jgi:hypothetical protein
LKFPLWYAELATLERTRGELLTSPTSRRMSRARLVDPADVDDVYLRLVAAHAVLPMSTAADELFRLLERNQPLPAEPDAQRPRTTLVWRSDLVLSMRHVEKDEQPALRAASRGATFAELARLFDGPPRALDVVLRWIDDGLVEA